MAARRRRSAQRAGQWASIWVAVTGFAYLAVLGAGFASLGTADEAISDPWYFLLEILILLQAPGLVLLFAAICERAARANRIFAIAGLSFMSATAVLTCALHFTLIVLRDSRAELHAAASRAFVWPSLPYAIDILAWDVFYPLAAFSAALTFPGTGTEKVARRLLLASGVLALAGLAGVALGDMAIRNIGILGYGLVLPVAALCVGRLFASSAALRG